MTKINHDALNLGRMLQSIRQSQNKTLDKFAEELGVSRQALVDWEKGARTPGGASMMKILRTYDPSLDQFKRIIKDSDRPGQDMESVLPKAYSLLKPYADGLFNWTKGASYIGINLVDVVEDLFKQAQIERLTDRARKKESDSDKSFLEWLDCIVVLNLAREELLRPNSLYQSLTILTIILGRKLKQAGYTVLYSDNDISLSVSGLTDESRNKLLGEIILEFLLVPETRLDGLIGPEYYELNKIMTKLGKMSKEVHSLEQEAINLAQEAGLPISWNNWVGDDYGKELALYSPHQTEDGWCCNEEDRLFATDSAKQMIEYLTRIDGQEKSSARNEKSFLVLSDDPRELNFELSNSESLTMFSLKNSIRLVLHLDERKYAEWLDKKTSEIPKTPLVKVLWKMIDKKQHPKIAEELNQLFEKSSD